jgi:hypothetical protein
MLEHIDAGWQLGEFSSTGAVFFCTKGVERRMVEISPSDPGPVATRLKNYTPIASGRDRFGDAGRLAKMIEPRSNAFWVADLRASNGLDGGGC